MIVRSKLTAALSGMIALAACGGEGSLPPAAQTTPTKVEVVREPPPPAAAPAKQQPPAGGQPREIHFPPIARETTGSGLEVNTVALHGVPVVQIRLVIKSGSARDSVELPGTAQIVAQMLKEGTAKRNSAKIAESVDFLGARLGVHNDNEQTTISLQALSEHLPEALALVAELATQPTFDEGELNKLRKRELDRLSLMQQSPNFLARREFWKNLYGEHPYAHVDTTKDVLKKIKRSDLAAFHRRYFTPGNAYLVVVGDVTHDKVLENANKTFKGWAAQPVAAATYPSPPARNTREIVLIDRPESVQSVISVGNIALSRKDPDYVPLLVANQVLGGSAASRMFMDLREKQSLTYGAYSDIDEGLVPVPFRAFAAVRNEVTAQALKAFFQHLDRISSEPATATEISDAKRLLIDSFPLHIETPSEIAGLVSDLRQYGFPDNYWDGFRAEIQAVTAERALEAAKRYIRPNAGLVVVVGKAAAVKEALAAYGPVRVLDTDGKLVVADPALPPSASAPAAAPQPGAARPGALAPKPAPAGPSSLTAPAPASAAHPASTTPKPVPPKDA
ncbi:MAG: pitrilysin family protein, partial [Polyangiales bacterium]